MEEIKGIKEFESKKQDQAITLSAVWEYDTINLTICDKDGNLEENLKFDCTDFHGLASDVMPPNINDLPNEEPSESDKKELEADFEEQAKNPIKKQIEELHMGE